MEGQFPDSLFDSDGQLDSEDVGELSSDKQLSLNKKKKKYYDPLPSFCVLYVPFCIMFPLLTNNTFFCNAFGQIFCAKCGSKDLPVDNDIILCDGACDRGFHQFCLEPPLLSKDSNTTQFVFGRLSKIREFLVSYFLFSVPQFRLTTRVGCALDVTAKSIPLICSTTRSGRTSQLVTAGRSIIKASVFYS